MGVIALDTFTDADGVNLPAHTPDLGFGGYEMTGAANEWNILGNRAKKEFTDNDIQYFRCTNDLVDDEFEVYADFFRSVGGDFQLERDGLFLLAHKTNPLGLGEGVEVRFFRNSAAPPMNMLLTRRDAAGVVQQDVLLIANLAFTELRLGATVVGLDVQVWTEPTGGGARTNRGGITTLTADLRDGNHKRFGLTGTSKSNAPRAQWDNFTVINLLPDPGQVQSDGSIAVKVGADGQVQSDGSIAVVRFVPEPDKFSAGVQFDGLNPRFYRGSSFQRRDS